MAAEIGAVDLGHPSLTADAQRLHTRCHRLAQLVRQDERRFVLDIELTAEASMLLPLTSLQKATMASRYVRSGSLCQANRVAEVIEKSLRHALQRHR